MMKLKPCPFCGSTAFIEETDPEFKDLFPYRIMCGNDDCPGDHQWSESEEAAIKAWNTRTPEEG
jgi:Lar family restriction alleviation protein